MDIRSDVERLVNSNSDIMTDIWKQVETLLSVQGTNFLFYQLYLDEIHLEIFQKGDSYKNPKLASINTKHFAQNQQLAKNLEEKLTQYFNELVKLMTDNPIDFQGFALAAEKLATFKATLQSLFQHYVREDEDTFKNFRVNLEIQAVLMKIEEEWPEFIWVKSCIKIIKDAALQEQEKPAHTSGDAQVTKNLLLQKSAQDEAQRQKDASNKVKNEVLSKLQHLKDTNKEKMLLLHIFKDEDLKLSTDELTFHALITSLGFPILKTADEVFIEIHTDTIKYKLQQESDMSNKLDKEVYKKFKTALEKIGITKADVEKIAIAAEKPAVVTPT